MAVVRLEEVYLYVIPDEAGSTENLEAAAFMDHSDVPFTKLYYGDPAQHQMVLDSINTWWSETSHHPLPPASGYPLVIYTEVHDDIPVRQSPLKYLQGLEAIKTFPELFNQYK